MDLSSMMSFATRKMPLPLSPGAWMRRVVSVSPPAGLVLLLFLIVPSSLLAASVTLSVDSRAGGRIVFSASVRDGAGAPVSGGAVSFFCGGRLLGRESIDLMGNASLVSAVSATGSGRCLASYSNANLLLSSNLVTINAWFPGRWQWVFVPAANNNTGWFEDFESYPLNGFPSPNWQPSGNNGTSIVDTTYVSPTQSAQLFGLIGQCWAALIHRQITLLPPYTVEFHTRNGTEALSGCHPFRAGIQWNVGPSWTLAGRGGPNFSSSFQFETGDAAVDAHAPVFKPLTWIDVKVGYDRPDAHTVRLTYWLDGKPYAAFNTKAFDYEDNLNWIALVSGEGTSWFDDISVKPGLPGAPTMTTLAVISAGSAISSAAFGSVIALKASVSDPAGQVTGGRVDFCDASAAFCTGASLVGSAQVAIGGTATLRLTPSLGSHTYKAVYAGTSTESPSTSSAVSVTINGQLTTSTALAASGAQADYTLVATVIGSGAAIAPTGIVSFNDFTYAGKTLAAAPLGAGTASVDWVSTGSATGWKPSSIAVADINGDGIPDLVVGNVNDSACSVTILLGNGDGTFTRAPNPPGPIESVVAVALGDFNNDGKIDIAAVVANNQVLILLGNGDGTFTAVPVQPATGRNPAAIVAADLNNDGRLDLAVVNKDDQTVTILLGSGDGTFAPAAASPVTGNAPSAIAAGDFSGDGNIGLAVANSADNTVTLLLGNGSGLFIPGATLPTGAGPASIAAADFDGNGTLDLATADFNGGSVTVYLGNGDGTFKSSGQSLATNGSSVSIAVADLLGEGKLDLIVANQADNSLTILMGNGDGTFTTSPLSPSAGNTPSGVAAAGLSLDALADIAVSDSNANGISVLLTQVTETAVAMATHVAPVQTGDHLVDAVYPGDTNYGPSTSNAVILLGLQEAPTLTINCPAVMYDGKPHGCTGSATGSDGKPVAGTWNYSPATETNAGSYGITGHFLSSDPNYMDGQIAGTLGIKPAQPVLLLVCAEVTYDAKPHVCLGSSTGVDGITVKGGWVLTPSSETAVGTYAVSGSFTSSDSNYKSGSASGTLRIVQAVPVISWPTPSPVPVGAVLGPIQLDPTANTAGTFVFTPPAGTVLPAGTYTLKASFTPNDTRDFTLAGASATLQVEDFTVTASPASRSVYTGEQAAYTVNVGSPSGLDLNVTLNCGGLPANTTCTFTPPALTGSRLTASLVVQTSAPIPGSGNTLTGGTPVGSYTLQITGASSSGQYTLTHFAPVNLNVKSLF